MSLETSRNVNMNSSQQNFNSQKSQEEHEDRMHSDLCNEDIIANLPNIRDLLDLDEPMSTEQVLDPPSSDIYMFGNDDDLVQALNEDPTWTAVTENLNDTPLENINNDTPLENINNDTPLEKIDSNTPLEDIETSAVEYSEQPQVNSNAQEENEVQSMELLDDFDLPELPELPVTTTSNRQPQRLSNSIDAIDFDDDDVDMLTTSSITDMNYPSPIVIDSSTATESEEVEAPAIRVPKSRDLSDTGTSTEIFSQRMQSLEITDQPTLVTTAPSPVAGSSRPHVTLRKRRAIQLKPFTLENAHFQKLISRAPAKSKLSDIGNLTQREDDDDSDVDFTPMDTQAVDESTDEIPTQSTMDSSASKKAIHKRLNKKIPLEKAKPNPAPKSAPPPKSISPPQKTALPQSKPSSSRLQTTASSSRPIAITSANQQASTFLEQPSALSTSQSSENSDYSQNLQKYGLDQLILPPTRKSSEKGKGKVITFSVKKKGSRKRISGSTKRTPSRLATAEPVTKDIFAFDLYPHVNIKPIVIHDSDSRSSDVADESSTSEIAPLDEPIPDSPIHDPITSPITSPAPVTNLISDDDMDEDEEELNINRRRLKRRRLVQLYSDDEDEELNDIEEEPQHEETLTDEQIDAIFNFPEAPQPRRHLREATEDDIVPIVDDEFEYREIKRQRMGIKDIKKKALKSVLPASFMKIYEKELLEEQRQKKAARKRIAPARTVASPSPSTSTSSTVTTSTTTSRQNASSNLRDTNDVFATFRASQSDDSDDGFDHGDSGFNDYDYDSFFSGDEPISNTPEEQNVSRTAITNDQALPRSSDNVNPAYSSRQNISNPQPPLAPIFQQSNASGSSKSNLVPRNNPSASSSSCNIPTTMSNQPSYPLEEATEDNRMTRQHMRSTGNNNRSTDTRRKTRRPNVRSSIAIAQPANINTRRQNHIGIRNNPTPLRRRKRPKRSTDDIYVHAPYFSTHWGNKSRYGNNDGRMFFKDNLPRRAFDDIYMGTKQQAVCYKNSLVYIGNYNIADYLQTTTENQQRARPIIYSLQSVIKRVRGLFDHDLRRVNVESLNDTVYLHHQLLTPLLSATPNKPSAYASFKDSYSELMLFGRLYFWKHIDHKEKDIINYFFAKVFRDLFRLCSQPSSLDEDIPDHDHFYAFLSICLTQWVPCYPYEDQIKLAELFADHIRGLAHVIPKLVDMQQHGDLPWKAIVKLMLFILDWTCRLHHLGVDRVIWSVTECTQLIMDMLVYIGYDAIKSKTNFKEYVIEAWICLIQIMSVSARDGGYYFNEQVFLNQLTDSIKRKSSDLDEYEFEKRKTTRLWAQSLDYILNKYMML